MKKMVFWPPVRSNFPRSAEWQTFREDAYQGLPFVPFYEDLFPHIEDMWVASGQTHRMSTMQISEVLGIFFRNGTLSSVLLPVSDSQVKGGSL